MPDTWLPRLPPPASRANVFGSPIRPVNPLAALLI
jgi:hypothetical protein